MMDEDSDEEVLLQNDAKDLKTKMLSMLKLGFILTSYGIAFISLVSWGLWIADTSHYDSEPKTYFNDWAKQMYSGGIFWNSISQNLLTNSGLLLLFLIQHSLMSERVLTGSKYWNWFHNYWEIDKAIYNVMTGIVLQAVIHFWAPTLVFVWSFPSIAECFKWVHLLAWIMFYGSNLMLDLPDLIGLNQVVISSPTMTVKSPELRKLYKTQRHMGLLPFTTILLVYPHMSLDRVLLLMVTVIYMYLSWRSEDSYNYASEMRRVKKLRTD